MSCTIIAEIGTAHQGSLAMAEELIAAAKESGATCAKFQAVYADEIIHKKAGLVPLPGGNIALYDRFKALEQPAEFYARLKELTEKHGLTFLCTPFGLKSFRILNDIDVSSYKIASPELNHFPLIDAVAATGRNLILSLGVSRLSDIENALDTVAGRSPVTLLHCVTSYPAREEDYNLNQLPHLKALFNVETGVSDHSMDPVLVPALACYLGASAVEKHICLSRQGDGLDDPIALEPAAFKKMCQSIALMGSSREEAYHQLEQEYGTVKIAAVLGTGEKKLAESEKMNYGRTNRSVCAINDIKQGEILSSANTALFRVEKELRVGLHPKLWPVILGRRASRTIEAGQGIVFDDLA